MYKGLMLTNAVPSAESDPSMFEYAISVLNDYEVQVIEFYTQNAALAVHYGKMLRDNGYSYIFHSALDLKRSGWCRLCSEKEAERAKSVDFCKKSLEKAISAGAIKAILQSGRYPEDPLDEKACLESLAKSMQELSRFVGDDIQLSIEQCDRDVEIKQLIGPTMESYSFIKSLTSCKVSLTMDTAHIALAYEDPISAIKLCKPYSNSIHLANCVFVRSDPLFGDKHPLFTYPNGYISDKDAQKLFMEIKELYGEEDLYISAEMICRTADEKAYLHELLDSMPWFYVKK